MTPDFISGLLWGAILATWIVSCIDRNLYNKTREAHRLHARLLGRQEERAARDADLEALIAQANASPAAPAAEVELYGGPCDGIVSMVRSATELIAMIHPGGRAYYVLRTPVDPQRKTIPYDFYR